MGASSLAAERWRPNARYLQFPMWCECCQRRRLAAGQNSRSARWDLFAELRDPYDADQLARALIPDSADASGREWRAYARTFLSSLLRPHTGCAGAVAKSATSNAFSSPTPDG